MTPSKRKMVRSFFYLNCINGSLQPTGGKAVIAWPLFLSKTQHFLCDLVLVHFFTLVYFKGLLCAACSAALKYMRQCPDTPHSSHFSVSAWVHFATSSWVLSYPLLTPKFTSLLPTLQPPSPAPNSPGSIKKPFIAFSSWVRWPFVLLPHPAQLPTTTFPALFDTSLLMTQSPLLEWLSFLIHLCSARA